MNMTIDKRRRNIVKFTPISIGIPLTLFNDTAKADDIEPEVFLVEAEGTNEYEAPGNPYIWVDFTHYCDYNADPFNYSYEIEERGYYYDMSHSPAQGFLGIVEDKVNYSSDFFVSEMAGRFNHTCESNYVDLHVEITGKVDATYDVQTWKVGDINAYC